MESEKRCTYCCEPFNAENLKPMNDDIGTIMEDVRRYCPSCLIQMNKLVMYWER